MDPSAVRTFTNLHVEHKAKDGFYRESDSLIFGHSEFEMLWVFLLLQFKEVCVQYSDKRIKQKAELILIGSRCHSSRQEIGCSDAGWSEEKNSKYSCKFR